MEFVKESFEKCPADSVMLIYISRGMYELISIEGDEIKVKQMDGLTIGEEYLIKNPVIMNLWYWNRPEGNTFSLKSNDVEI